MLGCAAQLDFEQDFSHSRIYKADRPLFFPGLKRQILEDVDVVIVRFHIASWIASQSCPIDDHLECGLIFPIIRDMDLSQHFLPDFRLYLQSLIGLRIVSHDRYSVPNILRPIVLEERDAARVLST